MNALDKNNISLSNVLEKFREFKIFSETGVKNKELLETSKKITRLELEEFAVSALKNSRRTEEEIIIKNLLLKNGINFVEQFPVLDSRVSRGGLLIADFFVQSGSSRIVIETSKITRTKGEAERQLSRLLAFKAYRIKKVFPYIISIAAIKSDLQSNSPDIGIIKEAFDLVLINDFEGLINAIKNALGVGFEPA